MNQAINLATATMSRNDEAVMPTAKDFESVLAALREHNGMAIDDHGHGDEDKIRKVHAIGRKGEHTVFLCSAEETPYFSINGMYVDADGWAHLSRWSVSGVINNAKYGSLEKAIAAFNEPTQYAKWYTHTEITDVTYF